MSKKLIEVPDNEEFKVININGDSETISMLNRIGLYINEPVTVIKHNFTNCIVSIKDARFALDNELARMIEVE